MSTILELRNIKKYYGKNTILSNVNLVLKKGQMIALVGESGAGKTTLLSIIGLLENPTEGRLIIANNDVTRLAAAPRAMLRRKYYGLIFQRARLIGSLTAHENVLLPAWLFGNDKTINKRAEELLCQLGLGERLNYLPEQLSVGQMRRVALARALLYNPEIILADEPTNDLDNISAGVVFAELENARNKGAAVILVTHEEKFAVQADKVLRLENGLLTVE